MSLLVDVQEVPWRILELVQQRILANRARMQRRRAAAEVRGFTRPRPQVRRLGATMSTYKAPEPAPLLLDDTAYAVAYLAQWTAGQTRYFRIYSCDASQHIEIQVPEQSPVSHPSIYAPVQLVLPAESVGLPGDGDAFSIASGVTYDRPPAGYYDNVNDWLYLPAGRDLAVAVFSNVKAWSYVGFRPSNQINVLGSGSQITVRAFLVGPSVVRELTIPSGLQQYINVVCEPVIVSRTNYRGTSPLTAIPFTMDVVIGSGGVGPPPEYESARFGDIQAGLSSSPARFDGYGPGSYSYVNNPAAARAALEAAGEGFWEQETAAAAYIGAPMIGVRSLAASEIDPTRALLYRGGYPPTSGTFEPISQAGVLVEDPIWSKQSRRVLDSGLTDLSDRVGRPVFTERIYLWDWGKPGYCRQQLQALGFTAADLTP